MSHPVLKNLNIGAKILKYLDNVWDLRNAVEASPYFMMAEEKHQIRDKIPGGTCRGCWEDQPNQQAHMNLGGCLYDPAHDYLGLSSLEEISPPPVEETPKHDLHCQCSVCSERRSFYTWLAYVPPDYSFRSSNLMATCECPSCRTSSY